MAATLLLNALKSARYISRSLTLTNPAFTNVTVVTNPTFISCVVLKQTRSFYRILTAITNRPDRERIKEIGPDRSCAEWLLRCGATFKWKNTDNWQKDYNQLVSGNINQNYVIEEVEAVEAGIMNIGFDHFDGCKHIRRLRFHHCPYLEDETLLMAVEKLKDSLEHLEITSCGDITEKGLSSIMQLSKLKKLVLCDLPNIRAKEDSYNQLKSALPNCQIDYKDLKKTV